MPSDQKSRRPERHGTHNDSNCVEATCIIKGVEYFINMTVHEDSMSLTVEDKETADQWHADYDANYLEDLTHKTGNYKQYSVFISMLESAILQTSDSVVLDILTYADLESLRNKKSGGHIKQSSHPSHSLNSKRYLILTYTVEFDKIHYPLPLPYAGKLDPRVLQETIRDLQRQIKRIKEKDFSGSPYRRDYDKLRKQYTKLLDEKEELEGAFLEYRNDVERTQTGTSIKDLRLLKDLARNLERDLIEERTKHQKFVVKRNEEVKLIMADLEDVRASERNLRVRVKSLTNELALYRRKNSRAFPSSSPSYPSHSRSAQSSRENSYTSHNSSRLSGQSRTDSMSGRRSRERVYNRSAERSGDRLRSDRSWERPHRPTSRGRSRTPSPAPRFDPTAYVKEKRRQKQEADLKRTRQRRTGRSGSRESRHSRPSSVCSDRSYGSNGSSRRRNPSPAPSVGSVRSHTSSIESLVSDIPLASDSEIRQREHMRTMADRKRPPIDRRSNKTTHSSKKLLSSTPERYNKTRPRTKPSSANSSKLSENGFDRSSEITEIDARLNRLQEFMKANLPMTS